MDRRSFNAALLATLAAANLAPRGAAAAVYRGPNVILVRFGGGVRRAETIDEATTWAPYLRQDLSSRGVLIPDLRIEQIEGAATSHAEGTLNLLTGRYLAYRHAGSTLLADRLEPTEPTLFDYLRDAFALAPHEALLVNGEDRPQEEFLLGRPAGHSGWDVQAEMLSLHRFKLWKTGARLAEGGLDEAARAALEAERADLLAADPRGFAPDQSAAVSRFWEGWRATWGEDGLRNPRGDRLLTELALRAMAELRPRLMMVNYQDPDYVHWGNPSHYTRAIGIIDEGLRRLVAAADSDPFYAGNTVFVITPDCGRDANPLLAVPFQHHFNSPAAHQVWALVLGPGIARGKVLDRAADQTAIAATIAALMGLRAERAEGDVLSELGA